MAYPPTIPPNNRTDATDMVAVHAADHNALANALNQIGWGRVASITSSATTAGIAAAAVDICTLPSVTTIAGRRYRLMAKVHFQQLTAAGHVQFSILQDGAIIEQVTYTFQPNTFGMVEVYKDIAPAAGAKVFKTQVLTTSGSLTLQGAGREHGLLLEDIGV